MDKKEVVMEHSISIYENAVDVIKTAILQSQARATKAVNQEQLALYYGIGRYVSANTRKKNWGKGAIESISSQLRKELPGLRGFSATSIRNMRTFYLQKLTLTQQFQQPNFLLIEKYANCKWQICLISLCESS